MLVNTTITKSITNRNISLVSDLGIVKCGEYDFSTLELFVRNIPYKYPCICDKCSSEYNLVWSNMINSKTPENYISFCGPCRSKIALEKMKVTVSSDEHRAYKSDLVKRLLREDESYKEAHRKAAENRKNFWCKTDRAKEIAIGNLRHYYGENHHNWNPNKNEFSVYKSLVYKETTKWQEHSIDGYIPGKRGLNGIDGAIQLDHIVSIKFGFDNDIDPKIIGHICNLRFISWEDNRDKWHVVDNACYQNLINEINKFNSRS